MYIILLPKHCAAIGKIYDLYGATNIIIIFVRRHP